VSNFSEAHYPYCHWAARSPARTASILWIDERGGEQATGFNSAHFREMHITSSGFVTRAQNGAFLPAITKG